MDNLKHHHVVCIYFAIYFYLSRIRVLILCLEAAVFFASNKIPKTDNNNSWYTSLRVNQDQGLTKFRRLCLGLENFKMVRTFQS